MTDFRNYLKKTGIIRTQIGGRIMAKQGAADEAEENVDLARACEEALESLLLTDPDLAEGDCVQQILDALSTTSVDDVQQAERERKEEMAEDYRNQAEGELGKSQESEIGKIVDSLRAKAFSKPTPPQANQSNKQSRKSYRGRQDRLESYLGVVRRQGWQ